MTVPRMSRSAARRAALHASGLASRAETARPDVRHFRRVMSAVDLVQLDSVNVSARTHYWVFFSRIGPYDRDRLDHWLWRSGEHFEYWAHEASILPQERRPFLAHRMRSADPSGRVARLMDEHPGYVEAVLEEVRRRGPMTVSDLEDPGRRTGPWWGYGRGKIALEWWFRTGEVTVADRRNFTRHYDAAERVIRHPFLEATIEAEEAKRRLVERSSRALGVGTAHDIADYYRLKVTDVRRALPDVIASGQVREVEVEGWTEPAYRHVEAVVPRQAVGSTVLSPFDPIVWFRPRVERLFDFHYRIEIYLPEAKRVHGYYVLPFLLDGDLAGRVDLKTDRSTRTLQVRGAFSEPGLERRRVARALGGHLESVATWLGCDTISVGDNGDLAADLSALAG